MNILGAAELFESALTWLEQHYGDFRFFAERDLVWTVQTYIQSEIASRGLSFRVFNDHTISPERVDLAILQSDTVFVAAEFKYEPCHSRRADRGGDIWPTKLPVVSWAETGKDVQRIRQFVEQRKAKIAYSILIDEGGHFRGHDPHPGSQWAVWDSGVWMLHSRAS